MHTHFLGIDIAKSKFDCALLRPDGKVRNKVLSNNAQGFAQLLSWLDAHGVPSSELAQLHVCMEATGIYWEALAEFLCDQAIVVSVINPAQIKSYGASRLMRSKTDKIDANLIAQFAKERTPAPWTAPAPHERVLRSLVLRLEALQNMLTQESNRLQVANPAVQPQIQNHIDWLNTEIKALATDIHAVYFEEVRRHAGVDAAHVYGGLMATLTTWCEHHNIAYQGVPVGTIKKHATGKGNAGKGEVIAAMRLLGHPVTDDNEADALALLHWAIDTQEV